MTVWMKKEETCFTNLFIKKIDKKSLTPQILEELIAESFYNVKYGSSINTSKVNQKISVMKT